MISPKNSISSRERDDAPKSSGLLAVPKIFWFSLLGVCILATCIAVPLCIGGSDSPAAPVPKPKLVVPTGLDTAGKLPRNDGSGHADSDEEPKTQDEPKVSSRRATRNSRNRARNSAGRKLTRWARAMNSKPERADGQDYSDNHPITDEAELTEWLATSEQLSYADNLPSDYWTAVYKLNPPAHGGFVFSTPLTKQYDLARLVARAVAEEGVQHFQPAGPIPDYDLLADRVAEVKRAESANEPKKQASPTQATSELFTQSWTPAAQNKAWAQAAQRYETLDEQATLDTDLLPDIQAVGCSPPGSFLESFKKLLSCKTEK